MSAVAGPLPLKVLPIKKHEPLRNISDHRSKRNGKEASMWNYLPNTVVGDDYIWRKNGHLWQIRLEDLALDPVMRLGPHNQLVYCLLLAFVYYQLLTRFQVGPSFDGPAELVFME